MNGRAERLNRTLLEMMKVNLLSSIHFSDKPKYWNYALMYSVHTYNRSPHSGINHQIPAKLMGLSITDVPSHLRPFGAQCHSYIPKEKRSKMDCRSTLCYLLSYSSLRKAYVLLRESDSQIIESSNVKWVKTDYDDAKIDATLGSTTPTEATPFPTTTVVNIDPNVPTEPSVSTTNDSFIDDQLTSDDVTHSSESDSDNSSSAVDVTQDHSPTHRLSTFEPFKGGYRVPRDEAHHFLGNSSFQPAVDAAHLDENGQRRSLRIRQQQMKGTLMKAISKANRNAIEPESFDEAIKSPNQREWIEAINNELDSLITNGTFTVVPLPDNRKPIKCKYVFKIKYDSDGTVDKFKARLVARGFSQKKGLDYNETFSPVVNAASLRLLLSIAAQNDLELDQLDVKTAFLLSTLDEDLYMDIPPGLKERYPHLFNQHENEYKCLKLHKSIYGLKQASKNWNDLLQTTLNEIGLKESKVDKCIYIKRNENEITNRAGIYVDDIVLASKNPSESNQVKDDIKRRFRMNESEELNWFLGIQIRRTRETKEIFLTQKQKIQKLLHDHKYTALEAAPTPMTDDILLKEGNGHHDRDTDAKTYQSIVGSLLHIMLHTRPDICFAVTKLAQFMQRPKESHLKALIRILRYLKGTQDYELRLGGTSENYALFTFTDSDWANDVEERKSTNGYIVYLNNSPINWKTKKQSITALSSTEAEYIGMSSALQEHIWTTTMLSELGINCEIGTMYEDNQSAIHIANAPRKRGNSKHIDVRHHFIREQIKNGKIKLEYLPTDKMIGDAMTKPLSKNKFRQFRQALGVQAPG
jgi:histone deacetylase 1/2